MEQQCRPGRYPATVGVTRKRWTQRENEKVMECYLRSQPEKRGYRRRMINIWKGNDMFEVSEQHLMDQLRQIKEKKWLSDLEIERIKRKVNNTEPSNLPTHNEEQLRGEEVSNYDDDQTQSDVLGTDEIGEEWCEEEKLLVERIQSIMNDKNRNRLLNLKRVDRKKVSEELKKVEAVLSKMPTSDITQTNDLIYAATTIVTENLGVKAAKKENKSDPWWKRRLEGQIQQLRRNLS